MSKFDRVRMAEKFQGMYSVTMANSYEFASLLGVMQAMMMREHYPDDVIYRMEEAIEIWTKELRRQMFFGGTRAFIVTRKGESTVIGCLLFNTSECGPLLEQKKIHLRSLYILPEYRKPGPAVCLMAAAYKLAQNEQCDVIEYTVDLNVDKENRHSYECFGGNPRLLTCSGKVKE